jgi:hypothetical protein
VRALGREPGTKVRLMLSVLVCQREIQRGVYRCQRDEGTSGRRVRPDAPQGVEKSKGRNLRLELSLYKVRETDTFLSSNYPCNRQGQSQV